MKPLLPPFPSVLRPSFFTTRECDVRCRDKRRSRRRKKGSPNAERGRGKMGIDRFAAGESGQYIFPLPDDYRTQAARVSSSLFQPSAREAGLGGQKKRRIGDILGGSSIYSRVSDCPTYRTSPSSSSSLAAGNDPTFLITLRKGTMKTCSSFRNVARRQATLLLPLLQQLRNSSGRDRRKKERKSE